MNAAKPDPPGRLTRRRRTLIPPAFVLSIWRLRVTWRLLVAAGLGIMAAVMLVCAVPLFARVALSAGLREAVNQVGDGGDLVVSLGTSQGDAAFLTQARATADTVIQRHFKNVVNPTTDIMIQTPYIGVNTTGKTGTPTSILPIGLAIATIAPHVTIQSGRLPNPAAATFEIALTSVSAQQLHVGPGSILSIHNLLTQNGRVTTVTSTINVVGIFDVNDPADPYWHNTIRFDPIGQNTAVYPVLADANSLMNTIRVIFGAENLSNPILLHIAWYYHLRIDQIDSDHLSELIAGLHAAENELPAAMRSFPSIREADVYSNSISQLQAYQQIVFIAQIPVVIVLLQILALVFYFITMLANLLVDRQADAIAVLRSRGANRSQIFGALAVQSLGLGAIALVLGPAAAFLVTRGLTAALLNPRDRPAIATITNDPLGALVDLRWYALIAAGGAVLAMINAIWRATNQDVLGVRRNLARATQRPFWIRFNLDLMFVVLAFGGYALYNYVISSGIVNPGTRVFLSPLAMIAPFFILLAAVLFALRVLPWVLNRAAALASRARGATSMLALAQTSRAPQPAIRMVLLLALSLALTLFTLIFSATQAQRVLISAAYAVGADYSGSLPTSTAFAAPTQSEGQTTFGAIPGILGATLGYRSNSASNTKTFSSNGSPINAILVEAVDSASFAKVAAWDASYSDQPLSALMMDLAGRASAAKATNVVPAYVDDAAWKTLHLIPGAEFSLPVPGYTIGAMHLVAAGRVHNIPGFYDAPQPDANTPSYGPAGGILVDFATYSTVYAHDLDGTSPTLNAVWLRSVADPAAQPAIRSALQSGATRLEGWQDRRQIIANAQGNPFQLNLIGILGLGTVTALVLAVFGNLLASWLSAGQRVSQFAVLRALGAAPRQIAASLFVEQGIIYASAMVIGIVLGGLLSFAVLPALIFTNYLAGGLNGLYRFYLAQDTPPIHLVLPVVAVTVALGVITLVCLAALILMTHIATRPSIAATLRVNED